MAYPTPGKPPARDSIAATCAMDGVQNDVLFLMAKMQVWIWCTVTLHLVLWLARSVGTTNGNC